MLHVNCEDIFPLNVCISSFCLVVRSQLWLLVFMLAVIGFSLGMTAIPTFPEIITCAL